MAKPLTAEQAIFLLQDMYMPMLKAEHRMTKAVLEAVPADFPESAKTPADFAAWYAERFEKNCEALTKLSGDQLFKMVDFRGMFQRPAVTFLQIGLNHSIHHSGQLTTYLRPMGGKVPAIYGESYDSALAKKAAG